MSDRDNLRELIGSSIVDGELRYLSVSSMTKAAPRANGCYLRWYNEKVLKLEPERSENAIVGAEKGHELHSTIDQYLTTGQNVLVPLAHKGMHLIPTPGPGLHVELPIHVIGEKKPNGFHQIHSLLTAADLPIVGFIDLLNLRGTHRGEEGDEQDPPGTVEVLDWKRKGNAFDRHKNALWKRGSELIYEIQMAGYGEWVRRRFFDAEHIRLSHVYFFEKGKEPLKSTKLHAAHEFENAWKYGEEVARSLRQIAREPDASKVPGNMKACDAYGGCPHRASCDAYKTNSLAKFYGDPLKENDMGLISTIPTSSPDMRAQLAQEEAQLRAQQPALQQNVGATLADALTIIERSQQGYPQLSGAAAQAVAQTRGFQLDATGWLAGSGALAQVALTEVSHLFALANDIEVKAGRVAPFAVAPPAPAAAPAPVAPSGWGAPAAPQVAQPHPAAGGILPPGTPASIPVLAAASAAPAAVQPPVAAATEPATIEEAPKKKAGRPKKTASDTAPAEQIAAPAPTTTTPAFHPAVSSAAPPPPSTTSQVASGAVSTFSGPLTGSADDSRAVDSAPAKLELYVNARPLHATTDLRGYVDMIHAQLAKRLCTSVGGPTVQDIRVAPSKDSILAYTGWKGVLRDAVIANPPVAAAYHLDVNNDELYVIVADALRAVIANNNGLFVQGLR